jgi:hypothetical protein
VVDNLGINGIGAAFAKRQIVYGIKQIGFSHSVVTDKAIDFWGKFQLGLRDIFVVDDGE